MKFWKIVNRIIIIIGFLGSIATLFLFVYPPKENINLQVSYNSFENLTTRENISEPEIRADYFFKGEKIENLWKVVVSLTNISDKTIIGKGSQKNILPDSLTLLIKNNFLLIDKKKIMADFNHSLNIVNNNIIYLTFDQWRKSEKLIYCFYIQSLNNGKLESGFIEQPDARQIIDGDITFKIYNQSGTQSSLLTDLLPLLAKRIGYIFGLLFILLVDVIFILVVFQAPTSFYKKKNWYKRYYDSFKTFVNNKYKDKDQAIFISGLIKNPAQLNKKVWSEFEGKEYPDPFLDFDVKKPFSFFMTEIVCIIFSLSLLILLMDLVQYFP